MVMVVLQKFLIVNAQKFYKFVQISEVTRVFCRKHGPKSLLSNQG